MSILSFTCTVTVIAYFQFYGHMTLILSLTISAFDFSNPQLKVLLRTPIALTAYSFSQRGSTTASLNTTIQVQPSVPCKHSMVAAFTTP